MRKIRIALSLCLLLLTVLITGCGKMGRLQELATSPDPVVVVEREESEETETAESETGEQASEQPESEPELQTAEIMIDPVPERVPVKVKGVYISAYVAGTASMMENVVAELDRTEANTVVIDLKDDFGRVVCEMDSPLIQELGSVKVYVQDMPALMGELKDHGIYAIARIPAFRDAWLGEVRPEWCVQKSDGTVFKDRDGNAWVNPYKEEAWDYLVEIGTQAKALGFDEVQFDYLRFCTERGMQDVTFDEADTQGRSRTDIICEFMEYAYEKLKAEGLFVSADVFGAIINSDINANSVGQIYGELAKHVDYISPMIYPSHYGDGNYNIDHPDIHPYETITAALMDSRKELYFAGLDGDRIATVRPWLQDFTATWLAHHISYGPEEVRTQIQATYDAGYDEWMLWDASCHYSFEGLLTPEEAEAETERIAQSRAALPETTFAEETVETVPMSVDGQTLPAGNSDAVPIPTGSAGPTVAAYTEEDGE